MYTTDKEIQSTDKEKNYWYCFGEPPSSQYLAQNPIPYIQLKTFSNVQQRKLYYLNSIRKNFWDKSVLMKFKFSYIPHSQGNRTHEYIMLNRQTASQGALVVKNPPANAGDTRDAGSIPGLERSPGGGNGNWLQYSWLGNCIDAGAWRATVHGVAKSRTWLSNWAQMDTTLLKIEQPAFYTVQPVQTNIC